MAKQTAAKTPTVAIARVLRSLGLKQGTDFRVKGQYDNGERVGTYVICYNSDADKLVADHADQIEEAVQLDGGFTFRVSVYYTPKGRPWVMVANYGTRIREAAPVATVPMKVTVAEPVPAFGPYPGSPSSITDPAAAEPVSVDVHPYDGLAQRPFGSLTWACEEAGQVWIFQDTRNSPRYTLRVYNGRADVNGWYLYGGSLAGDRVFMGATLTIAAMASATLILRDKRIADGMDDVHTGDPVGLKVDRTRAAWPQGTRVTGRDTQGKLRNGTVNGRDVGVVTMDGHPNFGRAYVGVTWDSAQPSYADHQRPFADDLTRISTTR